MCVIFVLTAGPVPTQASVSTADLATVQYPIPLLPTASATWPYNPMTTATYGLPAVTNLPTATSYIPPTALKPPTVTVLYHQATATVVVNSTATSYIPPATLSPPTATVLYHPATVTVVEDSDADLPQVYCCNDCSDSWECEVTWAGMSQFFFSTN
jgi:hypothetical protein